MEKEKEKILINAFIKNNNSSASNSSVSKKCTNIFCINYFDRDISVDDLHDLSTLCNFNEYETSSYESLDSTEDSFELPEFDFPQYTQWSQTTYTQTTKKAKGKKD